MPAENSMANQDISPNSGSSSSRPSRIEPQEDSATMIAKATKMPMASM